MKNTMEYCVLIRDREGSPEWRVLQDGFWSREDAERLLSANFCGTRQEFTIGVREHIPFSRLADAPIVRMGFLD